MAFKKLIGAGLCGIMLLSNTIGAFAANRYITMNLKYDYKDHYYNAEEVFVNVNGNRLTDLTMPPIILNNSTLVPAREVFEAAGATVEWKADVEQVYITKGEDLVIIPINTEVGYLNGNAKEMATPAKIINNKTMIPLRFASESLKYNIEWDNTTREAFIYDPAVYNPHGEVTQAQTQENVIVEETISEDNEKPTEAATVANEVQTKESVVEQTTVIKEEKTETTTVVKEETINVIPDGTVGYNSQVGAFFFADPNNRIDVNYITHSDNYNNLKYSLILQGDYSQLFTSATYSVDSEYVNSFVVTVEADKTTITMDEKQIMAMVVTKENGYVYCKPVLPKEKYSKIIVLDAGHGGEDPGASGMGLIEKELTVAMTNKARALFDKDDTIKCYVSRTDDSYPSFDDRTDLANEVGDAFISVHINAATNSAASGTETYSLYPNDQGNGLTGYMLAERILNKLLNNLGTVDRQVKSENWIVLRQSDIPSTLIEIGFITNADDARIMASEEGKDGVAKAIYDSVVELFNEHPPVR